MAASRRDSSGERQTTADPSDKPRAAMALMVEALELIDATEGATVAGAHLDLAIHRLQEWIDGAAR